MFDIFDVFALAVIAVLFAAFVAAVVALGSLPGWIAKKRGHPQASAVNVAGWLGLATLGVLWPLALIWAFWKPRGAAPAGTPETPSAPAPDAHAQIAQLKTRVDSLEAALAEAGGKKEVAPWSPS